MHLPSPPQVAGESTGTNREEKQNRKIKRGKKKDVSKN